MRKSWITGAGLAVVVAIAVAVGVSSGKFRSAFAKDGQGGDGAKGPDAAASAPPLEFRAAEVVKPAMATLARTVQLSGPLVAPNTAVVRAKTAGTLLQLEVAEGQRVKIGQVIARIDVTELNTRVAERQANIESARAALVQAERTHASNERLAAQSFISPMALDASRAQLDTAKAALAAAMASMDTSRVGLRDATPQVPIGGIVAKRHVVPGEKVSVEQTLVTVVDLSKLELAGTVGTHEVASLAPGMPVQVKVEGVDQAVVGRIARIAPAAEAGTRAIGVTVELANPGERLRAGQYAMATVVLSDEKPRMVLPAVALGSNAGQSHVWTIENGLLARRVVTTGRADDATGRVEIISGIAADAQVLGARFDNLREGAKALIVSNAVSRQASAASAPTLR
jgi:RND family efflux transporter MFP subunit